MVYHLPGISLPSRIFVSDSERYSRLPGTSKLSFARLYPLSFILLSLELPLKQAEL